MKKLKYICFVFILMQLEAMALDDITIVNGSYGGGWELTAKVTGKTLVSLGLANDYKIETLEGGAGWRALQMFTSEDKYKEDILVQSEPLISGFLKKDIVKAFAI